MIIWLVILASALWVLFDAKSIGVKKGLVGGLGNMGPWGWFIATLLLWILGFPMYLYYRGKFKRAVAGGAGAKVTPEGSGGGTAATASRSTIEDLEKLAALKEKGHISESEFEAKKKQLLGL